jgi:hypothetical protein
VHLWGWSKKKKKTGRTKNMKMVILGDKAKQILLKSTIIKDRGRQPIDRVDSLESGFPPKRGRNKYGKKKGMNSV